MATTDSSLDTTNATAPSSPLEGNTKAKGKRASLPLSSSWYGVLAVVWQRRGGGGGDGVRG
jgi:hypothetical protein